MTPFRIKSVDHLGNVAYIVRTENRLYCVLSNGTPACLHYAGISGDEMDAEFSLQDAESASHALSIVQRIGHNTYSLR